MKLDITIFLYLFITLLKATQSQVNHGIHASNISPKINLRSPPTFGLQTSSGSNMPNIWSNPPICSPPTATAYFLPSPPTPPKVTVLNRNHGSNNINPFSAKLSDNVPPPTYPCPFCTGQLNVPLKIDIPPPPIPYPVLPGVIDRIPSIIPFVGNRDDNKCACRKTTIVEDIIDTSSLLPDTFNYDKELLEGFLNSLGL